MFKKGPDIDKKKLLAKASDVKKDSLSRLRNFRTLIQHLDYNEITILFKSHFSFIYHTFIDTFSNFDSYSKHKREDLECILFMLENILIYNPDLIKKRWQFYSITFVMQKLLHPANTPYLRQEGVRLFLLWYQILCDNGNRDLETMFASIVPDLGKCYLDNEITQDTIKQDHRSRSSNSNNHNDQQHSQSNRLSINQLVPPELNTQYNYNSKNNTNNNIPSNYNINNNNNININQEQSHNQQQQIPYNVNDSQQLPIKLCSIEPLIPISPMEQQQQSLKDERILYLDCLLQNMVTLITKPNWNSHDEALRNQEQGFAFLFNLFKKIYLQSIFPYLDSRESQICLPNYPYSTSKTYVTSQSVDRFVDEPNTDYIDNVNESNVGDLKHRSVLASHSAVNQQGQLMGSNITSKLHQGFDANDFRNQQTNHNQIRLPQGMPLEANISNSELIDERMHNLVNYQAVVIKWLTRILRQDIMPGQDELIKVGNGGSDARVENPNNQVRNKENIPTSPFLTESTSAILFQNMETTSSEMEVARRVIGTLPDNISIVHELFKRAFMNYLQPASMKRVVNVYKEWICNSKSSQTNSANQQIKFGYTSFGDLLQIFVINSSHAFITEVGNQQMLEEQVEMCKRIMNIYRYMVMKIYMNTATWEHLLNVMLRITERLFPAIPPDQKESTIGGRIAPAFFQTFIVSWIRANLYVHISNKMWKQFHQVMRNLVKWRELIDEWSNTMGSLTRVLVKHVYGLNLSDLPLDKPQDRRRRPRAMQSFSTAEGLPNSPKAEHLTGNQVRPPNPNYHDMSKRASHHPTSSTARPCDARESSQRMSVMSMRDLHARLTRSNSEGFILSKDARIYFASLNPDYRESNYRMRKIKSEYVLYETSIDSATTACMPSHNDVIDGPNIRETEHHIIDQAMDDSQIKSSKQGIGLDGNPNKQSNSNTTNNNTLINKNIMSKSTNQITGKQSSNTNKCVLLGGTIRGWTSENSVIMWRRMLGLFGNINNIDNPDNHLIAMRCLAVILCEFIKTRDNLGISIDNQSTPEQPNLVPPYTYSAAWLLEATHLPDKFRDSRLIAYKLLCLLTIRRHDIEIQPQYYSAFYEALYRGLMSPDIQIQTSIIKNSTRILSLELPGCTFLVQSLFEKSKSILQSNSNYDKMDSSPTATSPPKDHAIQIMNTILGLHKPIRKLMVIKPDVNNPSTMSLVAAGDIKIKVFESLLTCVNQTNGNNSNRERKQTEHITNTINKLKCIYSMSLYVYQELNEKHDCPEIDRLFDVICNELKYAHAPEEPLLEHDLLRNICDLIRSFADQAPFLCQIRPQLVAGLLQNICQLILNIGSTSGNSTNLSSNFRKEKINCLLICLEDWCVSVGKTMLLKPSHYVTSEFDDDMGEPSQPESLLSFILRSLDSVINGDRHIPDDSNSLSSNKASTSRQSNSHDTLTASQGSQNSSSNIDQSASHNRDRTMTNESQSGTPRQRAESIHNSQMHANNSHQNQLNKAIRLSCKVTREKLITYLGHYPFRQLGPASLSCYLSESDFISSETETGSDIVEKSNACFLVINDDTIVTFLESIDNQNGEPTGHIMLRNLCGKYCWNANILEPRIDDKNSIPKANRGPTSIESIVVDPDTFQQEDLRSSMRYDPSDVIEDGNSTSSLSSRSLSYRDPIWEILNQLSTSQSGSNSSTSITSQQSSHKKRNCPLSITNSRYKLSQAEETMIALLVNQRFQEINYCDRSSFQDRVVLKVGSKNNINSKSSSSSNDDDQSPDSSYRKAVPGFDQCRHLIQQLGYLNWEKRSKIDTLKKSARLIRELKNLDSQMNRETHKFAVIYVANGQEDKQSILSNATGSRAFEEFVSGLGWEVNLASHLGFKGGLQNNKSTGETSPYYCNITTEIMYHVSTRIPINGPNDDESLNKKLRHLGNDEIHIIWSEHSRDYRRGIIPTEFGDVIIAIYPMLTFQGYYRIQMLVKPDVPSFGPLFDNCVVHQSSLASLVRATAINASRAKRLKMPHYLSNYEERSRLIEAIVQNHKAKQSFEEFAVQLYQLDKPIMNSQRSRAKSSPDDGVKI